MECFEYELANSGPSLLIIPESGTPVAELRKAFEHCSRLPKRSTEEKLKSGMLEVLRVPWEATGLIIATLEKVGRSCAILA